MTCRKLYAQVIEWLIIQSQISVISCVLLRICGSRRKTRSIPVEDGAARPYSELLILIFQLFI